MHRDFKIGLIVGLVLLVVAMVWIGTHDSFSPQAKLAREQEISLPESSTSSQVAPPSTRVPPDPFAEQKRLPVERDTPIVTKPIFTAPLPEMERQADITVTPIAPPEKEPPELRYHQVEAGQTLSTISKIHYGTTAHWKRILEANSHIISDAHMIRPGMRLVIPEE